MKADGAQGYRAGGREGFLGSVATALTKWSTRWVPDAYVIAVILTVVTALMALLLTKSTPMQIVEYWGQGFWRLISFAMQMSIVIMTGHIIAVSPPVSKSMDNLASYPRTPGQAILLMAMVSMLLNLVNWGLGLVASAHFVRFVARKQRGVDYRLLVAAAFLGSGTTWHAGLSASAPLLVATPGHFLEKQIGLVPITQTIFSTSNIIMVVVIVASMGFFITRLMPREENVVEVDPGLLTQKVFEPPVLPDHPTPAQRLEHSCIINLIIGIAGVLWLVWYFATNGLNLTLDVLNFAFLVLGILLHWTPASFIKAAQESGNFIWGVILQFPLYAGMSGIISYSNLAEVIGAWFTTIATARTFPLITFWYSGLLNYFVPSGGSKWAIEAPYILTAGKTLGVPAARTVMAYAWGDMITDLIQPFWALPLLGVAKLGFRDILGFTLVIFAAFLVVASLLFMVVPVL